MESDRLIHVVLGAVAASTTSWWLASAAPAAETGLPPAGAATSKFCSELQRIGNGTDDPGEIPPYDHTAKILDLLLPDASEALKPLIAEMRDTFAAVGVASAAGKSVLPAFAKLGDPRLIDVEHALARGIRKECGIALGDPAKWPKDTAHSAVPPDADQPACPGWGAQSNAVFKNRFPFTIDTSGANYWDIRYKVEPSGWIDLAGEYPHARYFSYLPNDMHTDNLHQLTDVHIDPDPGSVNPWRQVPPAGAHQRFSIHFVFGPTPANPAPNTSYLGLTKHGEPNQGGIIVYRIYGSDLGNEPNSAGVKLPAITIHAPDGHVVAHYDECQPYSKPLAVKFEDVANFPPLPIPGSYVSPHPKLSNSANYNLPVDMLANPDVQYATFFLSHRFGDLFVVHARAFTTPDTRRGEPRSKPSDIEGWTVCNYNLTSGIAQTCRMDHDLKLDRDGNYTLVVSTADQRPADTEATRDANWFDWGPYLDNQITWRFYRRDHPKMDKFVRALAGEPPSPEIAPYIPQAVYCNKAAFERGGWKGCLAAARRE